LERIFFSGRRAEELDLDLLETRPSDVQNVFSAHRICTSEPGGEKRVVEPGAQEKRKEPKKRVLKMITEEEEGGSGRLG